MLNILKQLNWVDILVVILFIRIGYVATKSGFLAEFFKLLGAILAIYLSLHYYVWLGDYFKGLFFLKSMPLEFLDFLSFLILVLGGYSVFLLLRQAVLRFFKVEVVSQLNKWGGFVLGLTRAFLVSSLVIFMLAISTLSYFKGSVKSSYWGVRIFKVAPAVYTNIWNGFASKFMNKEKLNTAVGDVEAGLK